LVPAFIEASGDLGPLHLAGSRPGRSQPKCSKEKRTLPRLKENVSKFFYVTISFEKKKSFLFVFLDFNPLLGIGISTYFPFRIRLFPSHLVFPLDIVFPHEKSKKTIVNIFFKNSLGSTYS